MKSVNSRDEVPMHKNIPIVGGDPFNTFVELRRIRKAAEKASSASPQVKGTKVGGRYVEIGNDDWFHSASRTEMEQKRRRGRGTMDR